MIEGALILLAGIAIGWLARGKKSIVKAIEAPRKLICSCTHTLAMHDPKTKACHAERWTNKSEYATIKEWRRCPCRRYDGPEYYPEFVAPELPQ